MRQIWYQWACALYLLVVLIQWAVATQGDLLPGEVVALDLSPAYGLFLMALALWLTLGRRRREGSD